MNLYYAVSTLLHFLVDDQQLTKFESMTTTNMVLLTATHRVTVTVEQLPKAVPYPIHGDNITWQINSTNMGIYWDGKTYRNMGPHK